MNIADAFITRIMNIGRVQEKIIQLLEHDVFANHFLSKHNEYWDSQHEKEADKLDESRMRFSMIESELHDILYLLQSAEEE